MRQSTYWTVENGSMVMFHSRDGLFFERKDGAVRVIVTKDQQSPSESNILFETTMEYASFASVVASMGRTGETFETWNSALNALEAIARG